MLDVDGFLCLFIYLPFKTWKAKVYLNPEKDAIEGRNEEAEEGLITWRITWLPREGSGGGDQPIPSIVLGRGSGRWVWVQTGLHNGSHLAVAPL